MPEDGLEQLKAFDAIYLGAVGFPGVPDHISLWGLLLPIRRSFDQYVNLRPVRLFDGVPCPLVGKKPATLIFMSCGKMLRVNTPALGVQYEGTDDEIVIQQAVFTRKGTDRILKYAFKLASQRPARKVTSATKSNGIFHSMPYWDQRFETMSAQYPQIQTDQFHIDILTANFVRMPEHFDVVVGSNLFGDILSDLGPACTGTIGIAPQPTSTLRIPFRRCLNLFMAQRRISTDNTSPTQSGQSGPGR